MFSEAIAEVQNNNRPNPQALQKRFDFALTKKLGIIKLPPPFWMQDPKINPRGEHLFWASLLLLDRTRIDQAIAVLALEMEQRMSSKADRSPGVIDDVVEKLIRELLGQFTDANVRKRFEQDLYQIVPEWQTCKVKEEYE